MTRRFSGVIAIEGVQTGDGRLMAPDSLTWAELPLPLSWLQVEMHSAPADGIQIGILDMIRRDGSLIIAEGVIDDQIPEGAEVVRRLEGGTAPFGSEWGISIDADDFDVEIIDNVSDVGEESELEILVASGRKRGAVLHKTGRKGGAARFRLGALVAAAGDGDNPEGDVLMEASADEVIERATRLRIRGATLCAIPAFDGARISLADQVAPEGELPEESPAAPSEDEPIPEEEAASVFAQGLITHDGEPIMASGFPITPPTAWFDDPLLSDPTPLTVTENGRVYGHIATFDRCHVGMSGCTLAPRSNRDYELFLTGEMRCAEGCSVRVGTLTTGIGHAPSGMDANQTAAHYDDTRAAAAYVAVGEDEFGIWVAGTVRPDLTEAQLVNLRASKPSGDWRPIGGKHELVAVLMVNTPGFPVARPLAASAVPQEVLRMAAERIDRRFLATRVAELDERMARG